jgi:hypothetical protein
MEVETNPGKAVEASSQVGKQDLGLYQCRKWQG